MLSKKKKKIVKLLIIKGRRCAEPDKKMDVTKYRKFLALARGKMEIKADITHDTVS